MDRGHILQKQVYSPIGKERGVGMSSFIKFTLITTITLCLPFHVFSQVTPILHSVCLEEAGQYRATFGYEALDSSAILIGPDNGFTYQGSSDLNLGQPEIFVPASVPIRFFVSFDGSDLEWQLDGNSVVATWRQADSVCNGFESSTALFVVGNANRLNLSDQFIVKRLMALGFRTTVKTDFKIRKMDIDTIDIIIISSTSHSERIRASLKESIKPIITWEPRMFLKLGIARKSGLTRPADKINVTARHPLAANYSGSVKVLENKSNLTWAVPESGSIQIANIFGHKFNRNKHSFHKHNFENLSVLFAFEKRFDTTKIILNKGTPDEDSTALVIGRRVGLFLSDNSAEKLTMIGAKLFDASVKWAIGSPVMMNTGFDDIVFLSDGTNTDSIFTADDYDQAVFRIQKSGAGRFLMPDYYNYRERINEQINFSASYNGVPLLVVKDTIQFLDTNAQVSQKIFFMTSLAQGQVFSNKLLIWNTEKFNLSEDSVQQIELDTGGASLVLQTSNGSMNGVLEFSDEGDKTIEATVYFKSGFIGRNRFTLKISKLSDGTWYNQ